MGPWMKDIEDCSPTSAQPTAAMSFSPNCKRDISAYWRPWLLAPLSSWRVISPGWPWTHHLVHFGNLPVSCQHPTFQALISAFTGCEQLRRLEMGQRVREPGAIKGLLFVLELKPESWHQKHGWRGCLRAHPAILYSPATLRPDRIPFFH